MHDMPNSSLSARELQIARAYCAGASYRQIADRMFIAPATVRTHLGTIYRKLGVGSKIDLLRALADLEAGAGQTERAAPRSPRSEAPSIAVLPFHNLSEGSEDYFADGVAEDIITGLSRIKWLVVIGRNSSFIYKGKTVEAKKIARDLAVRYVLSGTVRKAEGRVRITAQLVETEQARQVWAERYDRELHDIFALQDEITLSVLAAMEPRLRQAEIDRVKRKRPDNLDAYDLVLRAQSDVYSVMPDDAARALALVERALALEPTYATAHGFAAMCHHCLFLRGGLPQEHRAAAVRHARAAIAHGQDDAVALTLAGFSLAMDAHDRAAGRAAFEAAIALSPSSAFTYFLGSVVHAWANDSEPVLQWGERALRLSPFDPWRFSAYRAMSLAHFQRADYQAAADAARMAIQCNPAFGSSYMLLAAPLARLGRLDEAKAAAERLVSLEPNFRYGNQFAGVNCEPALAASLGEALRLAGVPE